MVRHPACWGIDLGQASLKALRLELRGGDVVATTCDYVRHAKILSQPDADPDDLTRVALEQFVRRNGPRGEPIAISIPGQTGLARFLTLPAAEPREVLKAVQEEARRQIPFDLNDVVWDHQMLGASTGSTTGQTTVALFAMKRDGVNRHLGPFSRAKIGVDIAQMAPVALCNYLVFEFLEAPPRDGTGASSGGKKACIGAIDMGADNSNLVITDGDQILWMRPIPIGGNHFTRALTKDLKLTFAKGEALKLNVTRHANPKEAFEAMRPVYVDLAAELKHSLEYFTNAHGQAGIQRLVALGAGFQLPGLLKFLSEKLQRNVERVSGFRRLKGLEVPSLLAVREHPSSFAVACGLALQGLGVAAVKTNLNPAPRGSGRPSKQGFMGKLLSVFRGPSFDPSVYRWAEWTHQDPDISLRYPESWIVQKHRLPQGYMQVILHPPDARSFMSEELPRRVPIEGIQRELIYSPAVTLTLAANDRARQQSEAVRIFRDSVSSMFPNGKVNNERAVEVCGRAATEFRIGFSRGQQPCMAIVLVLLAQGYFVICDGSGATTDVQANQSLIQHILHGLRV